MKQIRWNAEKNTWLKNQRGVSFEEVIQGKLIAIKQHPQINHQRIMFFEYNGYVWVVPFIENETEIFLKTIFPSRKHTRQYKEGKL